jgi:hypothetical protein
VGFLFPWGGCSVIPPSLSSRLLSSLLLLSHPLSSSSSAIDLAIVISGFSHPKAHHHPYSSAPTGLVVPSVAQPRSLPINTEPLPTLYGNKRAARSIIVPLRQPPSLPLCAPRTSANTFTNHQQPLSSERRWETHINNTDPETQLATAASSVLALASAAGPSERKLFTIYKPRPHEPNPQRTTQP